MPDAQSPTVTLFEEFFGSYYKKDLEKLAEVYPERRSLNVDYKNLDEFNIELADELIHKPYMTIQCAREAIQRLNLVPSVGIEEGAIQFQPHVRFHNMPLESRLQVRNINSSHINTMVSTVGVITKITDVKPRLVKAAFECRHCGRLIRIEQSDIGEQMMEPVMCTCERKSFRLLVDQCSFIDTQRAEIQEPLELLRGGEQAKTLTVWIQDDLTNKIVPGNKIEITGVLRLQKPKHAGSIYDKFLDVNQWMRVEQEFEEVDLSDDDKKRIIELSKDPKAYDKIVSSIAPSIYGLREIKEAISLQLFGGTPGKVAPDGMRIRPDIHLLLIGDPGCLVADERVVLGNGTIAKIGQLGQEHLQNINIDVLTGEGGKKRDKATVFHSYRQQPVIEVITESGKSIKGTHNHPLLSIRNDDGRLIREWKSLDEMKIGDRLAVATSIPCTITAPVPTNFAPSKRKYGPKFKGKLPMHVTDELAALMGYIIGDGWIRKYRTEFVVAEQEQDILPKLEKMCRHLFGLTPSIKKRLFEPSKIGKRTIARKQPLTYVTVDSEDIASNIAFLKAKRVPDTILQSGNKAVASFLRWLFEADGCVFDKGRGNRSISLKSKEIELLRDVQILLLRFGIHSRIVGCDNLMIRRGESILKFAKQIGFVSVKKRTKLKQLAKSAEKFRRFTGQRSEKIEKIIIHESPEDVYDIEVPKGHRFIANGIISHNTAKTQLLRYVKMLAPKGLYVSGKSSSGAGLTATAEKDEFAEGGWTLKAGALVLAAGGMAMIDEFDKMEDEDRSSMHEAMESQQISVAKAGIVTTFRANATILAAANPKYGRFDPFASPAEQFDIPVTILSRFDCIFPIRDVVDEVRDRDMAAHILHMHQVASAQVSKVKSIVNFEEKRKKILPDIDPDLLRKYIAYARREVFPTLSEEALKKIQGFYTDLRKLGETQKAVPITARQLEAIVRLAEASAKGRFSQLVEEEDAERAIGLFKYYMKEIGLDRETGQLDIDIIATGSSRSKSDKLMKLFFIIKKLNKDYDEVQHEMVVEEAKSQGIKVEEIESLISTLKRNGDIYSPRYGVYKPAEEK
ncbi:ATP-binding protein [Candidatus Micrarchaeota archaeon]|nr:ATP-binding protein [Candidatus Micrarchaeota archaeon]